MLTLSKEMQSIKVACKMWVSDSGNFTLVSELQR